jgi:hypothetical protein
LVKVQVRVISSTSVSRRIASGKAAKGADICTMRRAASSSRRWPEDRLTSTRSRSPLDLMITVSTRLP